MRKKVLVVILAMSICLIMGVPGLVSAKEKMTMWVLGAANFIPAYNSLEARFEKENPDIALNRVDMGWDELSQKVTTGFITGGGLPDVMEVPTGFVSPFIKMKMFAPTPEWVMTKEQIEEQHWSATLKLIYWDGEYYGLPFSFCTDTNGLVYNKEIWEQAGVTPEDCNTWENFIETSQKLTLTDASGEITRPALALHHEDELIPGWILQYGGKLFSDEEDEMYINTPMGKEALQTYKDIFLRWKIANPKVSREAFEKGQLAAVMVGPYYGSILNQNFPSLEWGFFPTPSVSDRPPYFINSENWIREIPRSSKHKEAAFKWLKFMTNTDNAVEMELCAGEFSALKAACYDERMSSLPAFSPLLPLLKYAVPIDSRNASASSEIWGNITDKLKFGKIGVDEAALELEKRINEIWREYDALYKG